LLGKNIKNQEKEKGAGNCSGRGRGQRNEDAASVDRTYRVAGTALLSRVLFLLLRENVAVEQKTYTSRNCREKGGIFKKDRRI
jgi:hypothetical protein